MFKGIKKRINRFKAYCYYKKLYAGIRKHKVSNACDKLENILYINTLAGRGGAAEVAYNALYKGLSKKFHTEILAAENLLNDHNVNILPKEESKTLLRLQDSFGYQDFFYSASLKIKEMEIFKNCNILHLHNLHGGYFSPFALPELTALKPTIWTLHDMQSFTGHCAHSLDCDKWIEGCHFCDYLGTYPSITTDTSSLIYRTKKKIYDSCAKITIVAVSNWLKKELERSMLKNHDIRVIYNGVDEKVFCNYNKLEVRKELFLPANKKIILFCSDWGDDNPWKGGNYLRKIYEILCSRDDILFLCIGSAKKGYRHEKFYDAGFISDKNLLAKYYSAADLFLYPSIADSFPFVVLESMSCGLPVVSFDTGGIPEQICHMQTGYIAKKYDIDDLLNGVTIFIDNDELRKKASFLSHEAANKFTLDISLKNYTDLYYEIINSRRGSE